MRFIVQNIEAYLSNAVNEITLLILKLQELMCVKLVILLSKKASSNLQLKKNELDNRKLKNLTTLYNYKELKFRDMSIGLT